jgi:choline dehydrogenase-like flavoprotein
VRFDVVIAGGGTAGCVLAGRLCEARGRTVCLVEAGPDYGPYAAGRWPEDILDGSTLALDSHCWPTDDESDRSQLRARVLGGCSAHNACVVLAAPEADYDEWGPGWDAAALAPSLERARRTLRTRDLSDEELTPWIRSFADVAGDDAIVPPVNMSADGVRWNAAFAYVDPVRANGQLTIVADTVVDRVLLEGERAVGVRTTAGDVEASTVVLTAGAYGSPAILLRSGLGGDDGLPVGEGLCDHVGTGMGWEPTETLRVETDAWGRDRAAGPAGVMVAARTSRCPDGVHDLFLLPAFDSGYELSAAVFDMKPRSRGRVTLTSPDPRAPVHVEHGFLDDPLDVEVLVEGFEALRRLARADPIARYALREARPGGDVDAEAHVRATARGFFHPTGTCAIGRVVDRDCRVMGYEQLLVADASVMPTIPRVPVNVTTAAIAERVAELL